MCPAQDALQEFLVPAVARENHLVKMTVPKVDPKDEPPARQAGSESGQERSQAHSVQVSPHWEAPGWLPQAELQREPQQQEEPQQPQA